MNYKLTTIIAAIILALGAIALGYTVRGGILRFKESERVVSVKGLAEKEVMADKVIWPVSYSLMGNDLTTLYNEMERNNNTIISFVKQFKIPSDDITIAIPNVEDLKANTWSNEKLTDRYKITAIVTITTSDVMSAREAMKELPELMKKGLAISTSDYGPSSIRFEYNSLNDIKPQMIEEATKSARSSAEKFASDSNSSLGKIKTASQGQFSITTPDSNSPHKKTVRVVTTVNYYLND